MRKRSRVTPCASGPRPARTTKAGRRAAKVALAGARAAARHMKARFPDEDVPRLLGVAALARAMRPRPASPSWVWMRGNVVAAADGTITLQADPAGGAAVTVETKGADSGPDEPWASYDRSPAGRRSLTGAYRSLITGTPVRMTPLDEDGTPRPEAATMAAYEVTMTMNVEDVDPGALSILFDLPERKDHASE